MSCHHTAEVHHHGAIEVNHNVYFHNAGENELLKKLTERVALLETKETEDMVAIADIQGGIDAAKAEFEKFAAQVAAAIADLKTKTGDPVAMQLALDATAALVAEVQGAESALNPPAPAPTDPTA